MTEYKFATDIIYKHCMYMSFERAVTISQPFLYIYIGISDRRVSLDITSYSAPSSISGSQEERHCSRQHMHDIKGQRSQAIFNQQLGHKPGGSAGLLFIIDTRVCIAILGFIGQNRNPKGMTTILGELISGEN